MKSHFRHIAITVMALLFWAGPLLASEKPITVFAASSLTDVLQAHADRWSATTNKPAPRLSFGASATMARQIEAGAPADLFISANTQWAQQLISSGIARNLTPVASNRLVLVVDNNVGPVSFQPTKQGFSLLLQNRRLALADPSISPAGAYTVAYLQGIGVYDDLKDQLAYGQNVRQTLRLAERGGMPAFVYASDAVQSERLQIIHRVPHGSTTPIRYDAVLMASGAPAAREFLEYLTHDTTQATWHQFGFEKIASN